MKEFTEYDITLDVKEMICLLNLVMDKQNYFREADISFDDSRQMNDMFTTADISGKLVAAIEAEGNAGEILAYAIQLRSNETNEEE